MLNKDLWLELYELTKGKMIEWEYVGGHVGIKGNERCDEIATAFADGKKINLYNGPIEKYSIPKILDTSQDVKKAVTKSSSSSRSKIPAYSYISKVNGKIETHKTWAECEKRVKGVSGARFKKAVNANDEASIIAEFSVPRG